MEQTNLVIISIILASLPIISYFLQKISSDFEHRKRYFGKFIPVAYLDWVFVLFNILWIYVTPVNFYIVPLFMVVLIANTIFSIAWAKVHIKEKNPLDLYDIKKKKLTFAGLIHLIYAQIQATLVLTFFIFSRASLLTYLGIFFLMIYILSLPISSKFIHKKVILADWILFIIGIICFFIKIIWLL